jgi:hypothetical protein
MNRQKLAGSLNASGWRSRKLFNFLMVLTLNYLICGQASAEVQTPKDTPVSVNPSQSNSLEKRVMSFAQTLDLDAKQQSALRQVLEVQREQVMKVWSDSSVPASYRISATQAISNKTADQIRALLNEDQRKKYNAPRQAHEAATGTNKRSVEEWMEATKPKEAAVSPNQ